jgi:hypothetical protein
MATAVPGHCVQEGVMSGQCLRICFRVVPGDSVKTGRVDVVENNPAFFTAYAASHLSRKSRTISTAAYVPRRLPRYRALNQLR